MTTSALGPLANEADTAAVTELIGRVPQGDFSVVVRSASGTPVVVRNAPLLHDGTPMPTLYWLVGKTEVAAVGRLESTGAIDEVEALVGLDEIALIHERYREERMALMPPGHTGPAPSAGVGGTRTGVKCLHAHLANWLAGNTDAIGEWTAQRIADAGVTIARRVTT